MTAAASALRDLDYPSLLLRRDAVDHNIAVMRAFCQSRGVDLCPHAKTSMSPQITAQQLAAGAWGLTGATPRQVRRLHEFGVPRILLANVLVNPGAIREVASVLLADPGRDFSCYVDGVAG